MFKSRSVSRSASGGTVSIDASYAQDLLDFWMQKYEQVKGELDHVKVRVFRCNSEDCWRASQLLLKPGNFCSFLLGAAISRELLRRRQGERTRTRDGEVSPTIPGFPTSGVTHSSF